MRSPLAGLLFLVIFALSQAVRDTYFANTFQSVSFLFVAGLAFGLSILLFGGAAVVSRPSDLRHLCAAPVRFVVLNVTTAFAWLAYFFALKHLEPAVVNMIYVGVGPLVILVWRGAGQPTGRVGPFERICVGASLLGIMSISLFGLSGIAGDISLTQIAALICVALGGISITVSHVLARRFNDDGVGSAMVFGSRFIVTAAAAVTAKFLYGVPTMRPEIIDVSWLALLAFTLIVIPSFSLQLGIARSPALAVNTIRALGPVFVFAAQQLDDRLSFSGATLVCVLVFAISTILASGLRARDELRRD